ncbi:MAG: MBOAT family protein [Bacteroidetes bacterium]|nr:MAG: MBOAT family protein [Bacteroidota bacterium]
MIFDSVDFAIFLPIIFILYWFVLSKKLYQQNILLLVSSYFFYACWDYRFLFLLMFSTFLDYYTGIKIAEARSRQGRHFWLWLSIGINVGFLGIFKYYNFFITSFQDALALVGVSMNVWTLSVILPVGISFYTFHGLSYVIDIYYERIEPERDFVEYAVFVSFFPLLVAGPIERATHLLPQIKKNRVFEYERAVDGLRQILWGLFKKIVVADNCAQYANMTFGAPQNYSGIDLMMGAVFFSFQIYCDFSGYSDIALGTARLFGIELLRNFAFPYFSRDMAEFWRRWHISLSSWFRDYLYIPLGGSKGGTWLRVRNTFIIFVVSGFWHGSNWTFIVWGLLHALFIMPSIIFSTNRKNMEIVAQGSFLPTIGEAGAMLLTFVLVTLAWVFFRATNLSAALAYLYYLASPTLFSLPTLMPKKVWFFLGVMVFVEWVGREEKYALARFGENMPVWVRWLFYYVLILAILHFGGAKQQFIYFQF